MQFGLNEYLALARDSITKPGQAVAQVLGLNLPSDARWTALLAVVALSTILAALANALFPVPVEGSPFGILTAQPLRMALMQLIVMLVAAMAMARVGQLFGGTGRFMDALLLVVWIEAVLLGIQVAQSVLMLLFPLSAALLGLVAIALFFWLLANFTKELHGFRHLGLVAFGMAGTMVLMAIMLSVGLAALGILPPMEAMP